MSTIIKDTLKNNLVRNFIVKEAFTQEEIPGQENMPSQSYINILLELVDGLDIRFTELYFQGNTYLVEIQNNAIKVLLSQAHETENKYSLKSDQALLFYIINEEAHQFVINKVNKRSAIYLP